MADNVVNFDGITRLDTDPDRMLEAAKGELDGVVIIGWEKGDDGEFYFSSSIASGPEVNWIIDLAKQKLLNVEVE